MAAGNGLPVARSMDEVDRQLRELAAPLSALREQEEARLEDIKRQKAAALDALEEQRQAIMAEARRKTAVAREKVARINRTLLTLEPDPDREASGRLRRATVKKGSNSSGAFANPDEEVLGKVRDLLNRVDETCGPDVDAAFDLKKGHGIRYLETLRERGEARKAGKVFSDAARDRGKARRRCQAYRPMREVNVPKTPTGERTAPDSELWAPGEPEAVTA